MAMSATIAISPSTITAGQTVAVTLTVSNSGANAISVLSIMPMVYNHSATTTSVSVNSGVPALGPGQVISVPGSGSLVFSWGAVALAPQPSGSLQYDVGAVVATSDGSVFSPSTQTLTVNAPTH